MDLWPREWPLWPTRLLGVNHAKFMEMALDEKPQHAMERTQALVQKAEMGKGVLLLVDMGSLVSFGDIITEKNRNPYSDHYTDRYGTSHCCSASGHFARVKFRRYC
ncbi:hypothetical protein [Eubacterium aggregans]|uniref:PTS sugar transporter subunit IIA domain-containing protein n=1 Tax=Eubacterium aggregans TaxID=81409 RepID=UPI003F351B3E